MIMATRAGASKGSRSPSKAKGKAKTSTSKRSCNTKVSSKNVAVKNVPSQNTCSTRNAKATVVSKGTRPVVYKLPNEPIPGGKWRENYIFYFHPELADRGLQYSHLNYKGESIVDAFFRSESRYYRNRNTEFRNHKFRNVETMCNWLVKSSFVATPIEGGVLVHSGGFNEESRGNRAVEYRDKYKAWSEGELYGFQMVDDPSFKGVSDTEYYNSPKEAGLKHRYAKYGDDDRFYGRADVDRAVQRARDNISPPSERRYSAQYVSLDDLTEKDLESFGIDVPDLKIGDSKYLGKYEKRGLGTLTFQGIRRTK